MREMSGGQGRHRILGFPRAILLLESAQGVDIPYNMPYGYTSPFHPVPPHSPSTAPPKVPPQRSIPLSATFVKNTKKPGQYGEGRSGHGLSLRVRLRPNGSVSKTWAQKLRINGTVVNLGLGIYPIVTLAEAREKALANRRAVAQGRDPRHKPAAIPTFAEAAEKVIALHEPTWKHPAREARIWRSTFRDYVLPVLGDKQVSQISSADVLAVLTPIWQVKQETARRVRRRIRAVMRWCIARGHRRDNPAGEVIGQALPRHKGPRRHYPALPYSEVAAALRTVQASKAYKATILCFEFLVLTAARSGEARLARWEEIDFEAATWTIPAERMKAGRVHRVPLSTRALEVLREAQEINDGSGLLFPSATGRTLSDVTLSKLIKQLGIPAVPHGFRTSHRVWASEQTDAPRAVMEAALSHVLGDATEQAYARSDLFEKRRVLMQAWADYLTAE